MLRRRQNRRAALEAGRYGFGQILLLADQKLLFVISEYGKSVLVAATPERFQEVGGFQAISGKTWNHPVIAHGRLYARNSEEIACYQLAPPETHTRQVRERQAHASPPARGHALSLLPCDLMAGGH